MRTILATMFVIAAVLVTAAPEALAKAKLSPYQIEEAAKIAQRCQAKWDDNYRMRKYCQNRQVKAFYWTGKYINKHGLGTKPYPTKKVQFKIMARCWSKWTDEHGQNWPMVKYCVTRQEKAYHSL